VGRGVIRDGIEALGDGIAGEHIPRKTGALKDAQREREPEDSGAEHHVDQRRLASVTKPEWWKTSTGHLGLRKGAVREDARV